MNILESLVQIAHKNTKELLDMLFDNDAELYRYLLGTDWSTQTTGVVSMLNTGYTNPAFRVLMSGSSNIDNITSVSLIKAMRPGTMSPKVLKWVSECSWEKLRAAKKCKMFIDLDIYCTLIKAGTMSVSETSITLEDGTRIKVNVGDMFYADKLREWKYAYRTYAPTFLDDIKQEFLHGEEDYACFFRYVNEVQLEPAIQHIPNSFTFCGVNLNDITYYAESGHEDAGWFLGWDRFLNGDAKHVGFEFDLRLMSQAINARGAGEQYITVDDLKVVSTATKYIVDELLDRFRLQKFHDWFDKIERAQHYIGSSYNSKQFQDFLVNFDARDYGIINDYVYEVPDAAAIVQMHAGGDFNRVMRLLPDDYSKLSDIELIDLIRKIKGGELV
ncbi:MAG: hypothetical protein NC548_28645 [Lachnospiraceae bacterium]|nr:hypothetical protein [Lachnospiraceae bacterium]MCM1235537.1 hypothetical protein [Ruminococcus flavefaciens]